jgi:uncharacterized membrane protein YoaK (UPF0700 family)
MFRRGIEDEILPYTAEHDTGVLVSGPLARRPAGWPDDARPRTARAQQGARIGPAPAGGSAPVGGHAVSLAAEGRPPAPGRVERTDAVLPERVVTRLLAVLAVASGSLDVVCVTRLGGLFASVTTGNLVQLGRAIATVDGQLAARATTTVGGYAIGVAGGTVGLRGSGSGWRRRTSLVALVEVLLLTGVAVGWLVTGGHSGTSTSAVLLGVAAAAMGVQSTVTIGSAAPGASTTYLTGTLTSLVRALAAAPHRLDGPAAARVAAFVCGTVLGALVLRVSPLWAPALPVALVAVVVGTALIHGRSRGAP